MTNSRIEKISMEIVRIKAKIYEFTAKTKELNQKLSELEKQKITIENDEVIALFRKEKLTDDEFAALVQSIKKSKGKEVDKSPDNNLTDDSEDRNDDVSIGSGNIPDSDNSDMENDI